MINDFTDTVNKYHSQAKQYTGTLECYKEKQRQTQQIQKENKICLEVEPWVNTLLKRWPCCTLSE